MPVYKATTFAYPKIGAEVKYDYSRSGNPTRNAVEEQLASLEGGDRAFAFASGMAAVQLVLSVLKTGDEVVSLDDLYGGDFRYFRHLEDHFQIKFKLWNGKALENLQELLTPKTKLVWLETPSNPMMKSVDIQAMTTSRISWWPLTILFTRHITKSR